jgi:hypothetical protein
MIDDMLQALARWCVLVLLCRAEKRVAQPFNRSASMRIDRWRVANEMLQSTEEALDG